MLKYEKGIKIENYRSLNKECFEIGDYIECGSIAKVFTGKNIFTQEIFALKISFPAKNKKKYKCFTNAYYQEHHIYNAIKDVCTENNLKPHPNIVQYFGFFDDQMYRPEKNIYSTYISVFELCERKSLMEFIEGSRRTEQELKIVYHDIAKGLEFLHNVCKIIHMDIKIENILCKQGVWKIADFNLAAKQENLHSTPARGTPFYLSPELVLKITDQRDDLGDGFPVDIWGFGILMYISMFHIHPFSSMDVENRKELYKDIINNPLVFKEGNVETSLAFRDLVSACLIKDMKQRPCIDDILKHVFFK